MVTPAPANTTSLGNIATSAHPDSSTSPTVEYANAVEKVLLPMCVTHTAGHAHVLKVLLGQSARNVPQDTSTTLYVSDAHAVTPVPPMMYVTPSLEYASAMTNTLELVATIANPATLVSQHVKNANAPSLAVTAVSVIHAPEDASASQTTWVKTVENALQVSTNTLTVLNVLAICTAPQDKLATLSLDSVRVWRTLVDVNVTNVLLTPSISQAVKNAAVILVVLFQ